MFDMNRKKLDKLFISLCEEHHKKVVKYLYYIIGNIEDANDLAQEVFTIAYKRIEELEKHENRAGFIYQTAKFVAANYKRKAVKKVLIEQPLDEGVAISCKEDAYDTLENIEDKKIHEEDYVEQVITTISKEKQVLYKMHYIERKTYREIAEKLGVSEVSVRMKYVRLRREMKSIITQVTKENFS